MTNPRAEWDEMPDDDKMRHLYAWCENLTTAMETLRREVRSLQGRVSLAESLGEAQATKKSGSV